MEDGLVSQHAYTVTGAERVRLPGVEPYFLAPLSRGQHHMPSASSMWTASNIPSIHPETLVPGIFIPRCLLAILPFLT